MANSHEQASSAEALRRQARQLADQNDAFGAERIYAQLLQIAPDDVEALNFIARMALAKTDAARAKSLLLHALEASPEDQGTRKNLGLTLLQLGEVEEAEAVLTKAVQEDASYFVARLYLGVALQRLGKLDKALAHYVRAINAAQGVGEWTGPHTTPPSLLPVLEHALRTVHAARRRLFVQVMEPLQHRYGKDSLRRVEKCIAGYLGDVLAKPLNSKQHPTLLFFPDLPETPYLPRELFHWYPSLEEQTAKIRDELLALFDANASLEPFLAEPPPGAKSSYLRSVADLKPQWDGFFFYRHGRRYDENCGRCPIAAAALESTSIVHINGHAPEALFSVLGSGSHILPHHGVTNTRLVTHLPLIVPDKCGLRVGGEEHQWREGECITFDDTFEHEAWNYSTRTRVILLFDVWNPHLTDVEQAAITDLVAAFVDLGADVAI